MAHGYVFPCTGGLREGALTQHPHRVKGTDEVLKLPLQGLEVWPVLEGKVHPISRRVQLEGCFSLTDIVRHGNLQLNGQYKTQKAASGARLKRWHAHFFVDNHISDKQRRSVVGVLNTQRQRIAGTGNRQPFRREAEIDVDTYSLTSIVSAFCFQL